MGNFPQAFSHVALVNTAHILSRANETGRAAVDVVSAVHRCASDERASVPRRQVASPLS